MSRRIVRRAPLSERIQAYLNPWDFLLWLSEELNSNDWEDFQKTYGTAIGVALNFVFLVARANSGSGPPPDDDVFGDASLRRGSGWLLWFSRFVVHTLMLLSTVNAVYTFTRRRHYRLFERAIEDLPQTPSARRVRVDSSPNSASPFRFLYDIIASTSAESRAHPDQAREVTELAVWDPPPVCLRLFCLFSPAHVLVYCLFLPTNHLDSYPSVTVAKTMFLACLLSVQGHFLQSFFAQQTKDTVIIHKEVLHEYDTKYVHPSINRQARDVGVQTPPHKSSSSRDSGTDAINTTEVDIYSPYTIINRGFHTKPNPAYASQFDPDNTLHLRDQQHNSRSSIAPSLRTPGMQPFSTSAFTTQTGTTQAATDFSSPLRPPVQMRPPFPSPQRPPSPQRHSMGPSVGDGGSLGVYSHAASPLRKAASTNYLRQQDERDGSGGDVRKRKEGSPLKRVSMPGSAGSAGSGRLNQRLRDLRGDARF